MLEQIYLLLSTLSDILKNAILMFALLFIYSVTNFRVNTKKITEQIAIGALISIFVLLIMLFPWNLQEGIFIDNRSVLISLCAVFFGWLPTLIVAVVASVFRILSGGEGLYNGLMIIILPTILGLVWRRLRLKIKSIRPFLEFYIFGLIVHALTTLAMLIIPGGDKIISFAIAPFLGIFPFLTAILAVSLTLQFRRLDSIEFIQQQQILLQASIDSPQDIEIYALDHNYKYLVFNDFHKQSIKKYYQKTIYKSMNYLDVISIASARERLKENIDLALQGEPVNRIIKLEVDFIKYLEENYQPIYDSEGLVTGVTIFSSDVTSRIIHEKKMEYTSYHDSLTGFKNRHYYQDELMKYNPVVKNFTIILADVNGLKVINDAFGHEMGDEILKVISSIFKEVFLPHGEITRIGGDEFIIILENQNKNKAKALVEEAKKEIALSDVKGIKASVSFGIAKSSKEQSFNETFRYAENEMYRNKFIEYSNSKSQILASVLNTLFTKNPVEELHARRVAELCQRIGGLIDLRQDEVNSLRSLATFHDIGKIAIKEAILIKEAKLTNEEREELKRHPEIAYHLLLSSNEYAELASGVLHHHERFDGKGYPQGLKGKKIPLFSRIIAVAEAYDEMTSSRPYHKGKSHLEALKELEENKGKQFDPEIVDAFIKSFQMELINGGK